MDRYVQHAEECGQCAEKAVRLWMKLACQSQMRSLSLWIKTSRMRTQRKRLRENTQSGGESIVPSHRWTRRQHVDRDDVPGRHCAGFRSAAIVASALQTVEWGAGVAPRRTPCNCPLGAAWRDHRGDRKTRVSRERRDPHPPTTTPPLTHGSNKRSS